ncbi:MAG TPA: permease-like cell division protein FtsX [Candidatus Paceibacterota bacterium]|nr:permease-like cell division protein FtsX [Candidatus Paceibacterota bacterium]
MVWVNTKRIIKLGFVNFWRNGLVSVSSVLAMTITLFAIGSIYLGSNFLNSALDEVKNKVDISVAFKIDAPEDKIIAIKRDLTLLPEVKEVIYSSRDQELLAFRERHKDNAILIGSLDEVGNPFGARLNIVAVDPSQYEKISRFINTKNDPSTGGGNIIDQVSYKKDVVDRMSKLIEASQRLGWAIALVLALLSIFAVFNTISLAIYTSREEISVMRLVGAGNSYVKGPFMIEGAIVGVIASLLALVLLYPSVIWVRDVTAGIYGGINLVSFYFTNFGQIFVILLGSGILLGLMASYWAIRRYSKI